MNALIIVDVQNDFVPGGALAVPEGDRIVPACNALAKSFDLVVATQDWHPTKHGSFAANHPGRKVGDVIDLNGLQQILWPVHCVQNTRGAQFVPGLDTSPFAAVFQKGTDPTIDSYSGFFDNGHRKSTGLEDYLKSQNVWLPCNLDRGRLARREPPVRGRCSGNRADADCRHPHHQQCRDAAFRAAVRITCGFATCQSRG